MLARGPRAFSVQRDVLDAQRAAQLVEAVERALVQPERHRFHQRHPLVGRHRQLAGPQLEQEVDQHGALPPGLRPSLAW